MLLREYRYLLPLLAPAADEWMDGGVTLHDTHCFWLGGYFASMKSRSCPL